MKSQPMIDSIVHLHNGYRARVARGEEGRGRGGGQPAGSDMRRLVWYLELARTAQAHAHRCTLAQDCRAFRCVVRFAHVCQNLYI